MHDFRRLEVWRESIELARDLYVLTASFPDGERYGLVAQIRSAAVSVSSNIAEGAGRGGSKEMARFLRIALGSISELDSQVELAVSLGYPAPPAGLQERMRSLRVRVLRLHDRVAGARP
ncbi:MAG: four helix bundle protein [Acidimicrobiia bacterium]